MNARDTGSCASVTTKYFFTARHWTVFGLVRLLAGDIVTVSLSTNKHGRVIKDLLSVERPLTSAPPAASEPDDGEVRAVVKFFNDLRGYGFVTAH